jgi:hypothetical protein
MTKYFLLGILVRQKTKARCAVKERQRVLRKLAQRAYNKQGDVTGAHRTACLKT